MIRRPVTIILWLGIFLYSAFFSYVTVHRYQTLNARYFDLGIMHQAVHNTYEAIRTGDWGRFLEITNPNPPDAGLKQVSRLAVHNDPLLALLAPFYFIHDGAETLLIIQAIVIALGAWAVYKIARHAFKHSAHKDAAGLIFAFAYLLAPAVQGANLFEFHAATLSMTVLLMLVYCTLERRYRAALPFFLLALIAKENIALVTAFFGIALAVRSRFWRWQARDKERFGFGLFVFGVSIFWFLLTMYIIIPHFRPQGHFALSFFQDFGSSPIGIIKGVITQPGKVVTAIASNGSGPYIFSLLAPLGLLSLLAPLQLLIALPEFAINLLSTDMFMRSIYYHYTAVLIPFIFWSGIYGAKRLMDFLKKKHHDKLELPVLAVIAVCAIGFNIGQGAFRGGGQLLLNPSGTPASVSAAAVEYQKRFADGDLKVSASYHLAPLFSGRRYYYDFGNGYSRADYVIINKADINQELPLMTMYIALQKDRHFKLDSRSDTLEVYKKIQ